ncbi:MAG: cobyrinate a,c-diamide synthase [Pseudomonadota bacterium]
MSNAVSPAGAKGIVVAAPHSGSGKTVVTLGLARALKDRGIAVASAKVGPDYIDPAFHEVASDAPCVNLDLWAMGEQSVQANTAEAARDVEALVIEGVMGLFDGAEDGSGSTADVAAALNLPVLLVVDARSFSQSVAALLHGFQTLRGDVHVAGVIFNRVGSERHQRILTAAAESVGVPVLGCLSRDEALALPSRHLGLVQAVEQDGLEAIINHAANAVARHVDLDAIIALMAPVENAHPSDSLAPLKPLGQRIALAYDQAFSFIYPHVIDGWQNAGAEIIPFSPLNNEAPDKAADAVFLPGGYPELHAGVLAANQTFLEGLRARGESALVYGECGGFMVMGETLVDADGAAHSMAGLLPVKTSFAVKSRHLGYRQLKNNSPLPWPSVLRGHEFHYSTLISQAVEDPLFDASDAMGRPLAPMGLQIGTALGSYAHVISAAPETV